MTNSPQVPPLEVKYCEERQQRLTALLEEQQLDAILIGDPRHVHYYTAYWDRPFFSPLFLFTKESSNLLVVPFDCEWPTASQEMKTYVFNKVATMVEDQLKNALDKLQTELKSVKRLGVDFGIRPGLLPTDNIEQVDLTEEILKQRRAKYPDEVTLFRQIFAATEKAYLYAKENLRFGMTEVELYAGMQQVLASYQGETIGFFGNDFQFGSGGGLPRRRVAEAGELAVLDLGIDCRGYRSDMCRSYTFDQPSAAQIEARELVLEVIQDVEKQVAPGVSCREVYQAAFNKLDGYNGWSFPHHLGHGLGLSPHEAPHLNPEWDDTFEVGDIFTVEPGLYHADLKGGLRIEEFYHLSEQGLEKITTLPTEY